MLEARSIRTTKNLLKGQDYNEDFYKQAG